MKVTYNSWELKYKNPFGAVQANSTVKWAIGVDQNIDQATLWLTKINEDPVAYPMNLNSQSGLYQTQVKIGTPGLYHYYFALKQNNQSFYVEQGLFGQGHLRQDQNNLALFQLTCYERNVPEVDWYQRGVAYQIFPDRFANGNPYGQVTGRKKNSFLYATTEDKPYYIKNDRGEITRWDFFGGNLKGIMQKIPYLKQLGITTIYLNPIFLAASNHRYDTADFMKIDPMLGSEADLAALIAKLHRNQMHLVLDGVFNHVGRDSIYFRAALQNKNSPYYSWFNFINYPQKYQSWWGVSDLPETNKSNPAYQQFIYGPKGVLAKWTRLQVDGWRLDVADELPMPFLRNIRKRLMKENCQVLIGEVWEDASNKFVNSEFRPYVNGDNLTGVMNYPVRSFITNLLTTTEAKQELTLFSNLALLVEHYPLAFLRNCLNNIGTHDTARIKTVLQDDEKLVAIAFSLLFMLPGVPCIYYGDEAGLAGGKDPDNRRYFPWGRESGFLEKKVKQLISLRRGNLTLVDGHIGFCQFALGVNGLIRYDEDQIIFYCYNRTKQETELQPDKMKFYCLPAAVLALLKKQMGPVTLAAESDRLLQIARH